jgi:Ig-like domain CHU_C associated
MLFVCALVCAAPVFGISYLVPQDREMIQMADDIVVARAIRSHAELTFAGAVETIVDVRVERVFKGSSQEGEVLHLHELGGYLPDLGIATSVPGVPRYNDGEAYLIFTTTRRDGTLSTWSFQLGQFRFVPGDDGQMLAVRGVDFGMDRATFEPHVERHRNALAFLGYIQGIVAQTIAPQPDYFTDAQPLPPKPPKVSTDKVQSLAFSPAGYTGTVAGSMGTRWTSPSVTFATSHMSAVGAPLNPSSAATAATNAWTNDANSNVNYSVGANNDSYTGGLKAPDGHNTIMFGDPNGELSAFPGALGIGGNTNIDCTNTNTKGGDTFCTSHEGDVVLANSTFSGQQACLTVVLTHEVGHTLGFRHADKDRDDNGPCAAPLDCSAGTGSCLSAGAIMTSCTNCNFGSTLQPWDHAAVAAVYGSGATCTAPSITTDPSGTTISSGGTATLTVSASGTAPLSYQWYVGNQGNTSTPIGGATGASVQVSPSSTTSYWVQVTNSCGTANSATATVTVQSGCPTVTVNPPTATNNGDGTYTLQASASGGSGFTFQWFSGSPGSGSPIGSGNPITIPAPAQTTSYYVVVTNSCANGATSRTVTITVGAQCTPPTIVTEPQDATVTPGSRVQLTFGLIATSPFTVTWFQRTPPDTNAVQVGTGQTILSPVINTDTTFFATITNACGQNATSIMHVTVTQTCNAPAIQSATATPPTATPGQTVTLSVAATGTGITDQWYAGNPGDTSSPLPNGNAATVTVTPQATTTYWVRVSSGCSTATADSGAVVVTVSAACVPPEIVQPQNAVAIYGSAATLAVTATAGTNLHYAWFQGAKFDVSHPVGTDSPTLTTAPITQDTQFFVNVSNGCGNVNSETITVNVEFPRRRPTRR